MGCSSEHLRKYPDRSVRVCENGPAYRADLTDAVAAR